MKSRCTILMFLLSLLLLIGPGLSAQDLQLHYDARQHFPSLYFQYFKAQDSGKAFIKPGSFLLKTQVDMSGPGNNIAKAYIQVSQSFRFWKPKIFLSLQYNGGLGVTEPKQYSYYINNAWSIGLEYPFRWKGAWLSAVLDYKYIPYARPSHDPFFTFYWWSGYLHYKLEFSGDFSVWTENKDHGDASTKGLQGKRLLFFGEPQCWWNFNKVMAAGTKINLFYHINTTADVFQVYPTVAVRFKL